MLALLRQHGWGAAIFFAWLAVVLVGIQHHEFWRDEVRAFSIGIDATSPLDLLHRLENDGHPMLWHALLALAYWGTGSKLVLPAMSLLICAAAVALLCFRSPLPRWLQVLFVAGGLAAYEYSVMARNYGIAMLLMFVFAWLYPTRREHPLRLGLVIALLANTNVHSALLAGLLAALWLWDDLVSARIGLASRAALRLYAAMGIASLGAVLCLITVWPSSAGLVFSGSRDQIAEVAQGGLAPFLHPAQQFDDLLMPIASLPLLAGLILLGSLGALLPHRRLLVAALAGLLSMSILFDVIYDGAYRHEGLWLCFVITLAWIGWKQPSTSPPAWLRYWERAGKYAALPVLLALQVVTAVGVIAAELRYEQGAGAAFGRYLAAQPRYRDAILIGEPDYYLEAIRAYAPNDVYLLREDGMGHVVHFLSSARGDLTLRELLQSAWDLRQRTGRPVLLAIGHLTDLDPLAMSPPQGTVHYLYGRRTFSWSKEDLVALRVATRHRRRFDEAVGDERYAVYEVVAAPPLE